MKRVFKFVFVMIFVFSAVLSMSISASAESSANSPSVNDIRKYDSGKEIQLPKLSSYFDSYQFLYIDAPKGHSVNVYTHPDLNNPDAKIMPYAYHGSTFVALAEENGFICGIYPSDQNVFTVGWVDRDHINADFPGTTICVGNMDYSKDYSYYIGCADWSRLPFPGTDTDYSTVYYPTACPKKLDGIVIEYQVISRNGKGDVSGPRDVYIDYGSGWEYLTSYDLDPYNQTVRVWVMFDEPTEVKAVATIPQDSELEGFIFRQTFPELIYAS